jgi:hypothetical protein
MSVLPGKKNAAQSPRVAIVQCAKAYDEIFAQMMFRLRAEFQTRFILLTNGPKASKWYAPCLNENDQLLDVDAFHRSADQDAKNRASETFEVARKYEAKYGIAYLRDVIQQDRRYSPLLLGNAPYYPMYLGQLPNIAVLVARVNAWFSRAERWVDDEEVDLVFARPDGLIGGPLVFVAESKGVPVTVPVSARYKGRAAWTFGGYRLGQFVKRAGQAVTELPPDHETDAAAVRYTSITFSNTETIASPRVLLGKLGRSGISRAIMMANDLRALSRSERTSYITEIRRAINTYRVARWLERHTSPLERIQRSPYVLYLMNVEPEFGSHALAREFWNSLAIVQQLALSLPAGYQLVIKEHAPGIGNRALAYYETIARMPNIVFADYRLKGTDLAVYASCIATISGTIGYEASLMGKPVITFSNRTVYNWLPNIINVENLKDLPMYLRDAIRKRSDSEVAEIKKQAALLYEGIKATSFEASGSRIFKGGEKSIAESELESAYGLLLENLALQKQIFVSKASEISLRR